MLADKVAEKLGDDIYNRTEKIQGDLIEAFSEQTDELSKKVDKKKSSKKPAFIVMIAIGEKKKKKTNKKG